MKNFLRCFLICFVALSFLSGCAPFPEYGGVEVRSKDVRMKVEFTDKDRRLVHDYYRKNLPPGLAKKKHLPPGLQKHLAKNGKLPPGLEKRHLPAELDRKLSPLPEGYARVIVGNDIALIYVATQVIMDIIYDAY